MTSSRLLLGLAASVLAWATTTRAQATGPFATFEVLHRFAPGEQPTGPLVQSEDGVLFGTTARVGDASAGASFSIDRSGRFRVHHVFAGGSTPIGGLILAADGHFYGTTTAGVFRFTPPETVTPLYSFGNYPAGGGPLAGLTEASDAHLYGVAGGPGNAGSVFRIDAKGRVVVLHAFATDGSEGSDPSAVLIEGRGDRRYGVTSAGGALHAGTVFSISLDGEVEVVHSFNPETQGRQPTGGLTFGSDGLLYGTTCHSASSGSGGGAVYRIALGGKFEVLHTFTTAEGSCPVGELALFNDGKLISHGHLIGITKAGGPHGSGTVYRMDRHGTVTVLHGFGSGRDAAPPEAGVIQGADGALYGTTGSTANLGGAIYRLKIQRP